MSLSFPVTVAVCLVTALATVGCGNAPPEPAEEVADQTVDQLPPGHPAVDQTEAGGMLPTPVVRESTSLTWEKPSEWVDEPPANVMRQAQYRVAGDAGDAQCVVYYFGAGQGGSPQANAERWADQFDQPDGGSSRQAMTTESLQVGELSALLVEVTGTYKEGGMMMTGTPEEKRPGYMLLGAIVEGPDANWFFKFTGPEATVRANAEQFRTLIRSIQGPA